MREYTRSETLVANLPYTAMLLLGAAVIAVAYGCSPKALAAAAAYVAYGGAGAVWIMVFVCPYCHYHGTRGCPCGYGSLAARLTPKRAQECFARKFRYHIRVIVPLWFIPLIVGIMGYRSTSSQALLGFLAAFVLNSFVILPWLSRGHACSECPQKEDCPWMARSK